MKKILTLLVLSQILFSVSDLLARANMPLYGFHATAFLKPWFAGYIVVRIVAVTCMLYVYTTVELGKTRAIFGAVSIVLANALGFWMLNESLSYREYAGVALAVAAFAVLAFSKKTRQIAPPSLPE